MASPMLQEIFAGSLIGHPEVGFAALDAEQKTAVAAIAAGFVGLLSLFNIGGRFFWASLSDNIGRKTTYFTLLRPRHPALRLGADLRAYRAEGAVRRRLLHHPLDVWRRLRHRPGLSRRHFRNALCRRHPWPAADRLVDRGHRRARCGRLYPRLRRSQAGVERAQVYDRTLYILVGFLVVGFICNALIRRSPTNG